ncbi:MAG: hypothetical protein IPM86_16385 [Saprospiraceae bacterium]|nr:hypothetical protein [Saprospiraceae bacterium]
MTVVFSAVGRSNPPKLSAICIGRKLQILTRQSQVEITGCSRTDTGVHARRYFAHTDLDDLGLQS